MPYKPVEYDERGAYGADEIDDMMILKQDVDGEGRAILSVLNEEPANSDLAASQAIIYVDETTHELRIKLKLSNGTAYIGKISLVLADSFSSSSHSSASSASSASSNSSSSSSKSSASSNSSSSSSSIL